MASVEHSTISKIGNTESGFDDGSIGKNSAGSGPKKSTQNLRPPKSPRRPRNKVWMLAGVVLVVGSGLAAATVASSLSNRVDAIVATRSIAKGEVIADGDLRTASIFVGSDLLIIDPSQRSELIGQLASGPIGKGSILHPDQFVGRFDADEAGVVVGAALDPGEYPHMELKPGHLVKLIEVSGPNAVFDDTVGGGAREIAEGEVIAIAELARTDGLLISIRVSETVAILVSERAEQSRIRLALVDDQPSPPARLNPIDGSGQ